MIDELIDFLLALFATSDRPRSLIGVIISCSVVIAAFFFTLAYVIAKHS